MPTKPMDSYVAEIPENMEVKAFDKTEGPMMKFKKQGLLKILPLTQILFLLI